VSYLSLLDNDNEMFWFLVHLGMFDVRVVLSSNDALITARRGTICNVQNAEAGCMLRSIMTLSALLMPGNAPVAERLLIQ
jgi:hypothetical protein